MSLAEFQILSQRVARVVGRVKRELQRGKVSATQAEEMARNVKLLESKFELLGQGWLRLKDNLTVAVGRSTSPTRGGDSLAAPSCAGKDLRRTSSPQRLRPRHGGHDGMDVWSEFGATPVSSFGPFVQNRVGGEGASWPGTSPRGAPPKSGDVLADILAAAVSCRSEDPSDILEAVAAATSQSLSRTHPGVATARLVSPDKASGPREPSSREQVLAENCRELEGLMFRIKQERHERGRRLMLTSPKLLQGSIAKAEDQLRIRGRRSALS